jgi:DNA-binding LacI/PurR family transcriptional regulator
VKKTSIKDVARVAGYSIATVSLALRDSDKIAAATKRKILAAAEQLDYRPNLTASRLSSKRSKVVGIVLLPLVNDLGVQMLLGITEQLKAKGFTYLIEFTGSNYENEVMAVKRFIDERVDGVLLNSAVIDEPPSHLVELQRHKIPLVQMDIRVPGIESSFVGINNESGACKAVQFLIDAGHRRIACLGKHLLRDTKRARLEGYYRALSKRNIPIDPDLVVEDAAVSLTDHFFTETHRRLYIEQQLTYAYKTQGDRILEVLNQLFQLDDPPTAFFAVDNGMLTGLLWGLNQLGVKIPEDISVASFDGIPFLSTLGLQVTTMMVPAFEIGYEATRLLLDQMKGNADDEIQQIRIEPELLEGNTVAPLEILQTAEILEK